MATSNVESRVSRINGKMAKGGFLVTLEYESGDVVEVLRGGDGSLTLRKDRQDGWASVAEKDLCAELRFHLKRWTDQLKPKG